MDLSNAYSNQTGFFLFFPQLFFDLDLTDIFKWPKQLITLFLHHGQILFAFYILGHIYKLIQLHSLRHPFGWNNGAQRLNIY